MVGRLTENGSNLMRLPYLAACLFAMTVGFSGSDALSQTVLETNCPTAQNSCIERLPFGVQTRLQTTTPGSLQEGIGATIEGARSTAIGVDASSRDQSTAVGGAARAFGQASVAVGAGAMATGTNSVSIGSNASDGGQSNIVSFGSAGAERRLTNVSQGVAATDAATVGQVQQTSAATLATSMSYADAQSAASLAASRNYSDAQIARFSGSIDSGVATAMAVSAIPQASGPGKTSIGIGVGYWNGESAFALGVSHTSSAGGFVAKAGASFDSRGSGGFSGGAGWQF